MAVDYDEIGIWSEVKLAIIREYASAYSTILEAQRRQKIPSLKWLYIDAYAGPGLHLPKATGEIVEGSPSSQSTRIHRFRSTTSSMPTRAAQTS